MKKTLFKAMSTVHLRRSAAFLAIGLQVGCATLILLDVIAEWSGFNVNSGLEVLTLFALGIGAVLAVREFRVLMRRNTVVERELNVVRGEFQIVIDQHFTAWGLTAAEKDVALLSIKGVPISDIARMRATRDGTIKAQNAAIYRKAGVSSRAELISVVIEDLISGLGAPPQVS